MGEADFIISTTYLWEDNIGKGLTSWGFLAGSTILNPAEYRMALRLRILRSPVSLDVGDAEGGILCRCNRRVCLTADPLHFFHCPSSQGQYIRRQDHIRDALIDQIGDAIRPDEDPYDIEVEREPFVRAHLKPSPDPHQPFPERKQWQTSQAPMLVLLRTVTTSRTSKSCSALTGLRVPSGTSASAM